MVLKRVLQAKLLKSKKSILLLGPRQTGKSTLIRSLNPDFEINLADEETFYSYSSDPGRIKREILSKKKVFIDEIQRLPSLLNTLQVIMDENKNTLFYLTGSSARKLKRGQGNLLPGRIFNYELGPLCLDEIPEKTAAMDLMKKGLLPEPFLSDEQEHWKKLLRSYSAAYLKEEIQAEALTRNIEGFSRFFQIVASKSGDFCDVSKYASASQVDRSTARRFFEILEDTLVVYSLEAFTKSQKRRLVQHPRYYFFDVGVLNGLLGNFEVSQDRIGMLFEHLILQLLKSHYKAQDEDVRISTYRTDAGAEVDFIIERSGQVFAIEVKATKSLGPHDLRGLKSFREFYGKKHSSYVFYLGNTSQKFPDGTIGLPWNEGIKLVTRKSSR